MIKYAIEPTLFSTNQEFTLLFVGFCVGFALGLIIMGIFWTLNEKHYDES